MEGSPVNPFGFPAVAIADAGLPPQLLPDSVSLSGCSIVPGFPLARVGQLVAGDYGDSLLNFWGVLLSFIRSVLMG